MAKKRNRITAEMSKTIAESSPLIKKNTFLKYKDSESTIVNVNLDDLKKNPYQPRIDINLQSLNELISSIEKNGLMQPIVVTEIDENGKYTIIAGHRRFEAFKIMGKEKIPATIIKNIKNKDLAILSLTENLMRENLHPIENAIAMKNIIENKIVESQNKLAEYLGLSKGYVSKLMNILKLPASLIKIIKEENYKDINILVLLNKLPDENDMIKTFQNIKNLSRSDAEKYIKNLNKPKITINNLIDIKTTKTKINMTMDIKKLSQEQKDLILTELNKIKKIVDEWGYDG